MSNVLRCACLVFVLLTGVAHAQTQPRVEISAGAAAQSSSMSFLSVREFPYFAGTARLDSDHEAGGGIAFDLGVLVPIAGRVGARFALTRTVRDSSSAARGSFPHPFFFNADRTGMWTADALDLREIGVHVSLDLKVIDGDRFDVSLFGGPTFFDYDQGVIENVDVIENYPYDTIDARVVTSNTKGGTLGFHAGIDGTWFFSRHVGVGAVFRYAAAQQQNIRIGEGEPFDLDLGGAQGGGGIRIRF
jgi:hypothetical protein